MASDADLLGLGEHCSVGSCRQIDFLPFTCDCCKRVFCLEHRTYEAHSCPSAGSRATTLIVCPLCAKAVHLTPGQDPNVAFEAHQRAGCDPNNYNRVHKVWRTLQLLPPERHARRAEARDGPSNPCARNPHLAA